MSAVGKRREPVQRSEPAQRTDLSERAYAALDGVLDPCSVFNETELSIVELGMVDEVNVTDAGKARIRLFLDDPTCIFFFEISRMIEEALAGVQGVSEVELEIKADEIWTEERMSTAARARLQGQRRRRRAAANRGAGGSAGWPLPMLAESAAGAAREERSCGAAATGRSSRPPLAGRVAGGSLPTAKEVKL